MNRRSFIRIGMAGVATGTILPNIASALATDDTLSSSKLAGGLYYTKESPGRWSKKAGSHSPIVSKTDAGVRVLTGHPMIANKHWIIKHILLDKDFKFIAENMFDPAKDKVAMSNFDLAEQKGLVYALSVCNKHDTWVTAITV